MHSQYRFWAPNRPYFRGTLADCLHWATTWHKNERWIIEELTALGWKIVRRADHA